MSKVTLVVIAAMFATAPGTLLASPFCSLGAPKFQADDFSVPIQCGEAKALGALPYPAGPLYVGATLYKLPKALRDKVSPLSDSEDVQSFDLPMQAFDKAGSTAVKFNLHGLSGYTHALVVVWDQKNTCENEYDANSGCARFHYSLGRVDDQSFPIPIDAWPRPVCDKERLKQAGFFKWTKEDGDPSGLTAPRYLENFFLLNDCFTDTGDLGLGYSVRRWRVGPLSKSKQ